MANAEISVSADDLRSMLTAMEYAHNLHWCETCGAWLEDDDEALATTQDVRGCWWSITRREKDRALCRAARGEIIAKLKAFEAARVAHTPLAKDCRNERHIEDASGRADHQRMV